MAGKVIRRNNKDYYKVAKYPYMYKSLDGYYMYRLVHKAKKFRKQNNITQCELASRLSLTAPYIKRWESERTRLPKIWWEKIFQND